MSRWTEITLTLSAGKERKEKGIDVSIEGSETYSYNIQYRVGTAQDLVQ